MSDGVIHQVNSARTNTEGIPTQHDESSVENLSQKGKKSDNPYLNPAIGSVHIKSQARSAVRECVTLHPLMSLSSSLCSDSFDEAQLSQVDLQKLLGVLMPGHPGPCSSMTVDNVKACSVRSVVVIVRRRRPKMTRQDTMIFHTERHSATI